LFGMHLELLAEGRLGGFCSSAGGQGRHEHTTGPDQGLFPGRDVRL
jgi:hypothetical protein